MLEPKKLKKLLIAGPIEFLDRTCKTLHSLGSVHIVDYSKDESETVFDIGQSFPSADKYSELQVKAKSILSVLGIPLGKARLKLNLENAENAVNNIYKKVSETEHRLKYFEKLKQIDDQYISALSEIRLPEEKKNLVYYIGFVREDIEGSIKTDKYSLFKTEYNELNLICLFVNPKHDIKPLLEEFDFFPIPEAFINMELKLEEKPGPYLQNVSKRFDKEGEKLKAELDNLRKNQSRLLLKAVELFESEIELAEAPLRLGVSENTFFLRGWIPEDEVNNLKKSLSKSVDNILYVGISDATKKDKVPVILKNPKVVEPFEYFMHLYSLPTYKEIDPTFLMFLTFPIFFGFMLGDMGYGLLTLILFILLRRKIHSKLLDAMIISSISTIIFGFLFGEFFGAEELLGQHLFHIISRSEQINELLMLSILMGVIHINLGLFIGFINEYRHEGVKKAIFTKGSWIVLQTGIILGILSIMTGIPVIAGITTCILALIMLYKGEGIRGLIELPGLFGNILSYARLMAVGLASVSLAVVINDMAASLFSSGFLGILLGIFILIIGHTINIMLGILSPFLHSLRLHYVEFFTKFYSGGGRNYVPFGARR